MADIKGQMVCCRYGLSDLDTVKAAAAIMGQTVSAFTRTAAATLARAILEASAGLGDQSPGSGSWDRAWIQDARIVRKEDA